MPFGNGTHACPGNELAKLEISVLLHHLTTKYRWAHWIITKYTLIGTFFGRMHSENIYIPKLEVLNDSN